MSFDGKYILAAIDGTGSHQWRNKEGTNSHTFQFYRNMNVKGGAKIYVDGPGEAFGGVVLGNGSQAIIEEVVNAVNTETRKILGVPLSSKFTALDATERKKARKAYGKKLRIAVVGHSRGGMIAIQVAAQLVFPVYFLGLYDAVDMNAAQSCDHVHNVDHTFHAIRHPVMESRYSWGNCGDEWGAMFSRDKLKPRSSLTSSGNYAAQFFMTSHGGINGDPRLHPQGATDDIACSVDTLSAKIQKSLFNRDKGETCINAGKAANVWIRKNAVDLGILFQ